MARLSCLPVLLLSLQPGLAHSQELFREDFESYLPGSDLCLQGVWDCEFTLPPFTIVPVVVHEGRFLASQVIGGLDGVPSSSSTVRLFHDLTDTLSPNVETVLSAVMYHYTGSPTSHNTVVSVANRATFLAGSEIGWGAFHDNPGSANPCRGFRFFVSASPPFQCFSGHRDEAVAIEIVLDPAAEAVYGRLTDSGGTIETERVAVDRETILAIDAVTTFVGYRGLPTPGSLPAEIDDIRLVTSATAPIARAGTSLDAAGLLQLDGSLSEDANGDPLTFSWLIEGELTPREGELVSIADLATGNYIVRLEVSDGQFTTMDTMLFGVPASLPDAARLVQLAAAIREQVEGLPVSSLVGPNDRAREARRRALLERIDEIVEAILDEDCEDAIESAREVLARVDGTGPPQSAPDWVTGDDAAAIAQLLDELIAGLLTLGSGCGA